MLKPLLTARWLHPGPSWRSRPTPGRGTFRCPRVVIFPPWIMGEVFRTVAPSSAKPGDAVTVMAPDADCNPRYGSNARIQVIMTDAAGMDVVAATAPMNDAGAFT